MGEALEILFVLAVRAPLDFSKNGGSEMVFNFAANASTENLLIAALAVLMNISTTQNGISALSSTDCVETMLSMISYPLLFLTFDEEIVEDGQKKWPAKRDALNVLCGLCTGDPKNKEVFGKHDGVKKLVTFIT